MVKGVTVIEAWVDEGIVYFGCGSEIECVGCVGDREYDSDRRWRGMRTSATSHPSLMCIYATMPSFSVHLCFWCTSDTVHLPLPCTLLPCISAAVNIGFRASRITCTSAPAKLCLREPMLSNKIDLLLIDLDVDLSIGVYGRHLEPWCFYNIIWHNIYIYIYIYIYICVCIYTHVLYIYIYFQWGGSVVYIRHKSKADCEFWT